MTAKYSEKRKEQRIPVRIRIQYETTDRFFQDYIRNLSLGGIYIQTPNPLPEHTKLKIQLCLPEMKKPLVVDGVVVHALPDGQSEKSPERGMGIRFSALDNISKQLLEAYLIKHGFAN